MKIERFEVSGSCGAEVVARRVSGLNGVNHVQVARTVMLKKLHNSRILGSILSQCRLPIYPLYNPYKICILLLYDIV